MKKALLFFLILLMPVTAAAMSWAPEADYTQSPYTVTIDKLTLNRNALGFTSYSFGSAAAKNGDHVYWTVQLTVPDKVAERYAGYPQAAYLELTTTGITVIENGLQRSLHAVVPSAPGTYYLSYNGGWVSSLSADDVWIGYVTDSAKAAVTASVCADFALSDITILSDIGAIGVRADSGGFVFSNDDTGMYFAVTKNIVSAAFFQYEGRSCRVYQSGAGFGVNCEAYAGQLSSIASLYLKALGIEPSALFGGGVYMNEVLIKRNFGPGVDTSVKAVWYEQQTLPVTAIPSVPATGLPWDIIACVFALVCFVCLVYFVIRDRRK